MKFHFPFNWYNKFGTIPSEFREAMSYEEQILWLCQAHEELVEKFEEFKLTFQNALDDKQDKLIAGDNIFFNDNVISAYLTKDLTTSILHDYYINLSGDVGSIVNLTPVPASNVAYIIYDVKPNEEYIIYGKCTLAKLNPDTNEMISKFTLNPTETGSPYSIYKVLNEEGKLVISWDSTNEFVTAFYYNLAVDYVLENLGGGGGGSVENIIAGDGITIVNEGDYTYISVDEAETPPQEQFQKQLITRNGRHFDMGNLEIGTEFDDSITEEANTRLYNRFNLKKGDSFLFNGNCKVVLTDDDLIIQAVFDNSETPLEPLYISTWEYPDATQIFVSWYNTDVYDYVSYKLLSFGDLDRIEESIEARMTTITNDFNLWEMEEGLYRVETGVTMRYLDSVTGEYTIQNEYGYLIIGRTENNDTWNFTLFDKSSVGDNSGAVYCGYSKITEYEPNFTIIGNIIEMISTYTEYQSMSAKLVSGTLDSSNTYAQYPSAKVVYDTIQAEIGTISTALHNINVGSGVQ